MYALIQDDDFKAQEISKKLVDIELYMMEGSTNKIPIHLIKQIFIRKKLPKAVILRYINDSNSFIKSLMRYLTTLITVFLLKIFKIKLIWLCHNVDKESKEFYPFLIKSRRKMIINYADSVFVTDKLLMKHAVKDLKIVHSKINYITFGKPNKNFNIEKDVQERIIDFIESATDKNTLVGLSIGNPNDKVLHPFYTVELIEEAKKIGKSIKIILGGPLGDFIKQFDMQTYKELISNPNILFIDGEIHIDESYISPYIDFYWRVYNDYSVPYTVYNAVHFKKPILTMNKGFLKDMVLEYSIGTVLENDMSNIYEVINELEIDRTKEFNEFIDTHNWSISAQNIYEAIYNDK